MPPPHQNVETAGTGKRAEDAPRSTADASLPLPPLELRKLVGPTDPSAFDNPSGELIFQEFAPAHYDAVFEFGCGCGRIPRQLLQQRVRPRHYLGIDLHRGMIEWCQKNLAPVDEGFRFEHHDVYNSIFNPDASEQAAMFPVSESLYSLVIAHSVFTHLVEWQAAHYLREVGRILAPGGFVNSTWFLFDKRDFPMLGEENHALYARFDDPTAAVAHDADWVRRTAAAAGLKVVGTTRNEIRGHQWRVLLTHQGSELPEVPVTSAPEDERPLAAAAVDPRRGNAC